MKKINKKTLLIGGAVLLLILGLSSLVVTKPGEFRVIRQFGKIVRVETSDSSAYGVSFKIPFIQSETVISSKVALSDLPASDVMTSDKKSMISDCFVLWRIEDPVNGKGQLNHSEIGGKMSTCLLQVGNDKMTYFTSKTRDIRFGNLFEIGRVVYPVKQSVLFHFKA